MFGVLIKKENLKRMFASGDDFSLLKQNIVLFFKYSREIEDDLKKRHKKSQKSVLFDALVFVGSVLLDSDRLSHLRT